MTVLDITKDLEARTLVLTASFDVPIERVWELWNDPRQLERWWGPPTYPATVVDHDLTPGGDVTYYMTGPEGDRHHGWWRVLAAEPPRRLALEDGFADESGKPDPTKPTIAMTVSLAQAGDGATRMEITSVYPSTEAMQEMIDMGMEEGLKAAVGQIDDLLAQGVS